MKNYRLVAVALCGIVLLLAGCKTKMDSHAFNTITSLSQITPSEIQTHPMTLADSITVNGVKGTVKLDIDFPESGNFFVINNIREWMSEQMGGTYEGRAEDGDRMMTHYKSSILTDFQENIIPDMPPIPDHATRISKSRSCRRPTASSPLCTRRRATRAVRTAGI